MTLELPVLRLGLAGFTVEQQGHVRAVVKTATLPTVQWDVAPFTEADAWCVHGARTLLLPDGTLRIGAVVPGASAMQLDPTDVDRPVAFARPLPPPPFEAACAFDVNDKGQLLALLGRFSAWLRPVVAQFSLASCIIEQQAVLGGGTFRVLLNGVLIAMVDMRGDVCVLPTAGPAEFEHALWRRCPADRLEIPEHFTRVSLSQLMWNFAMRSRSELLPSHYRTGLVYFRRPPRLPQRLLRDSHLLLMRELACGCGTMQELQQRTGLGHIQVMRDLAALYLVGAITSNPKRAAQGATRRLEVPDSILSGPPGGDSIGAEQATRKRRVVVHDLTAPALLQPR